MRNGWFKESYRHSLAAKGVKTSLHAKVPLMKFSFASDDDEENTAFDESIKFESETDPFLVTSAPPVHSDLFIQKRKNPNWENVPLRWGSYEWQAWLKKKDPESFKIWYETKWLPHLEKKKIAQQERRAAEAELKEKLGKELFKKTEEEMRVERLEKTLRRLYPKAMLPKASPSGSEKLVDEAEKEKRIMKGAGEDFEEDEFEGVKYGYAAKKMSFYHTPSQLDKMMEIERKIGEEMGKEVWDENKIRDLKHQKELVDKGVL